MSAPPIAAVVVYPFTKLSTALAAKAPAAIIGLPGAMVMKALIVATLVANKPELMTCRPGRMVGRDDMRPASFKNATIEPVKVIPPGIKCQHLQECTVCADLPIRTPRYPVTIWRVEISATLAMTLPMLVKTAARPTTECRAATVWGRSVGVMRLPMIKPARVPSVARAPNWVSTSGENPAANKLARTPEPTPRIPSIFPILAVAWEARPEIEPMQSTELTRYPACTRPAAPVEAAARKPPPKTTAGTE